MDNAALNMDLMSESLGEEIAAAASHKVPAVTCTVEGPIQPEQIAEYLEQSGKLTTAQKSDDKDVATLRARHHSVARLLATGMPEGVVADLCNFTSTYLSTLKSNPSMIELINHYRSPQNHVAELITERLRTVGQAALDRILTELPDMDHQALIGVAKLGTDRSGNGPTSTVAHEHNHIIDLKKVQELAETARRSNAERIVPISDARRLLPSARPAIETEAEDEDEC